MAVFSGGTAIHSSRHPLGGAVSERKAAYVIGTKIAAIGLLWDLVPIPNKDAQREHTGELVCTHLSQLE